ncbi:hypothetical protein FA10DRAFT_49256 [Acaromyces ingoldii]|uniref:Uncharacterized protein n=1 Tax=Acaromyces ingoldii TaxID=215250 RepID=A0A316YBH3_9BASI|nr:hypothetical protein FA10DRAFT_49256 [Acaromyces ingoldii]PWN86629.1 hypothetical protein FA10DRAFT_49256 [Acaromyces ingoldii]
MHGQRQPQDNAVSQRSARSASFFCERINENLQLLSLERPILQPRFYLVLKQEEQDHATEQDVAPFSKDSVGLHADPCSCLDSSGCSWRLPAFRCSVKPVEEADR